MRDGLIARNPAALVTRPGVERREAKHLDADGVAALLRAAETSRYYPALVLIAATGLRKGEALALSWDTSIVNLDEGWLKVRKTLGRVGARARVLRTQDGPVAADGAAVPRCRRDAA